MATSSVVSVYDARRQVRVLYALSGLLHLNPHIAVWVIYLMEFRGISLAQVGLMEAIFWGFTLALEIPSGAFADRYGRKTGFLVGTAIEGAGILMFALASGFGLLMVSYVLWGGGIAFRSGNDGAFMYDALAAGGRQTEYADRMGVLGAVTRAAASAGAIVGGALADVTTLQVVVFVGAVMYIPALLMLAQMREPPRTSTAGVQSYGETFVEAWRVFQRRPVLRWVVLFEVSLLATVPIQFLLFQPFLRSHDVPYAVIGVLTVPVELTGAGGALVGGRLSRRFGVHGASLIAVVGVVSGLTLLAAVDHVAAMVGFVVAVATRSTLFPVISAYINDRVTSDVRATVLSVSPFGMALAFGLGAAAAGVAGDASMRFTFAGAATGTLVLSGVFLWMWRRAHLADPHGLVAAHAGEGDAVEVVAGD